MSHWQELHISRVMFMVESRIVVWMLAVSGDLIIGRRMQPNAVVLSEGSGSCSDVVLYREPSSSKIIHTYCSFIDILPLRVALLLLCCLPNILYHPGIKDN
jgi:hypothetical protein